VARISKTRQDKTRQDKAMRLFIPSRSGASPEMPSEGRDPTWSAGQRHKKGRTQPETAQVGTRHALHAFKRRSKCPTAGADRLLAKPVYAAYARNPPDLIDTARLNRFHKKYILLGERLTGMTGLLTEQSPFMSDIFRRGALSSASDMFSGHGLPLAFRRLPPDQFGRCGFFIFYPGSVS
jgi:hypothetical protein